MVRAALLVFLAVGCVKSAAVECDNGVTCPAGSTCDPVHGCVTQDQRDACAGKVDGDACMLVVPDDGVCETSVCIPGSCGDGYRTGGEACDGTSFGDISNCTQLGYYDDKPLGCSAGCEVDETVCTGFCGDGVKNGQELCDGALPTESCVDLGYGAGQLECSTNCGPAFSDCVPFGWKSIDMPHKVKTLHAVSPTNVWVVGDAGMVQHFDGASWSAIDASACTTTGSFDLVFAVSSTEAFVHLEDGGDIGVGLVTASGCTLYPTTEAIRALWAPSATELYAGADTGLFHLQGSTWTTIDTLPTQAVWGSGASDVYATTDDINDSAVVGQYRHYNGTSWSAPSAVANMPKITAVWGSSPTDVYLGGYDPAVGPIVMRKNGTSWQSVLDAPSLQAAPGAFPLFGTVAGARIYVQIIDLGTGLNPLLSGGPSGWSRIPRPFDALIVNGTSNGSLFAAAYAKARIYMLDGGVLSPMPEPVAATPYRIAATRADTAIALVTPRSFFALSRMWSWNGTTWRDESLSNVQDVDAIGSELFAIAAGTIRKFGGPGSWPTITTVGSSDVLTGLSGSELWYADNAQAYHWNGTSSVQYVTPFQFDGMWQASTSLVVAVGRAGRIAHFNGTAWIEDTSPTTDDLSGAWGRSATEIYAWGGTLLPQVVRFDGTSWSMLPTPPGEVINQLWAGGPADVFVAMDTGLWRFDGQRWAPVDSGGAFGATALTGVGDTLLIGNQDGGNELIRTRAW